MKVNFFIICRSGVDEGEHGSLSSLFMSLIVFSLRSWDEMAKYDFPAIVNFILKKTAQPSLYYAAHSQGCLIAFAELPRNKDLAQKIKAIFSLAPVAYLGNMESPVKYLIYFLPEIEVRKANKNL